MQKRTRRRRRRNRGNNPLPASYAKASVPNKSPSVRTGPKLTTIRNKETLMEYKATLDFSVTEVNINPGSVESFPWLHQQASAWEFYKINHMRFIYEPIVSTQRDGVVMMAVEYSPGTPKPADLRSILAYGGAVNNPVYRPASMTVDTKSSFPNGGFKYVRHNITPDERKLYDAGVLMLASQGGDGNTCGIISVEYEVVFKTPQVTKPILPVKGIVSVGKDEDEDMRLIGGETGISFYAKFVEPIINTLDGMAIGTIANTAGGQGTTWTVPPGTYRITSDVGFSSDIQAPEVKEGSTNETLTTEIRTVNDDGTTSSLPLKAVSQAYNSEFGEVFRRNNIVQDAIAFFDEPTTLCIRVGASFLGAVIAGSAAMSRYSQVNIQKLASLA